MQESRSILKPSVNKKYTYKYHYIYDDTICRIYVPTTLPKHVQKFAKRGVDPMTIRFSRINPHYTRLLLSWFQITSKRFTDIIAISHKARWFRADNCYHPDGMYGRYLVQQCGFYYIAKILCLKKLIPYSLARVGGITFRSLDKKENYIITLLNEESRGNRHKGLILDHSDELHYSQREQRLDLIKSILVPKDVYGRLDGVVCNRLRKDLKLTLASLYRKTGIRHSAVTKLEKAGEGSTFYRDYYSFGLYWFARYQYLTGKLPESWGGFLLPSKEETNIRLKALMDIKRI